MTPEKIITVISEKTDIPVELLLGPRRDRPIARPRQLGMYIARKLCYDKSLTAIGQAFGGRDHKTVMHACDLMDYLLTRDRTLMELYAEITEALGNG